MMFDQLISAEKLYMILESAREGLKYSVPPVVSPSITYNFYEA